MNRALPLGRLVQLIGWSFTLMSGALFLSSTWLLQDVALGNSSFSRSVLVISVLGVLLGGAGLILARLATHWLDIHLVHPLGRMIEVLDAVKRGGMSRRFDYEGPVNELRELSAGIVGLVSFMHGAFENVYAENHRRREAYTTMLDALEDNAAVTAEFRQSERRYRELAEAMPLLVWTATRDGDVDYFNARWEHTTGVSLERLLGWGWQEVLHAEDVAATTQAWKAALRNETPYEVQVRIRTRDGRYRWHLVRATPIRDDQGQLRRWIGATVDIEDQKRAAYLEAANLELREMDRLKDQFLSIISHELRTPINAITGFGSILEDELAGPLSAEQHAYLQKILSGADSLLALVDDLLDMSRIQAGKLSLKPQPADMHAIATRVLEQLAPLAAKKHHSIVNAVPAPLMLMADEQRVAQVLINLVNNAIKFTEDGGTIRLSGCELDGAVRLEVRDTGPGISPEDQRKLFQEFGQLDQRYTRKAGGTGLGLAISRGLIEAQGGTIGVESEPGEGSTFWFTLPGLTRAPNDR